MKFRCKASKQVYEFTQDFDIAQMLKHTEYEEVKEEEKKEEVKPVVKAAAKKD